MRRLRKVQRLSGQESFRSLLRMPVLARRGNVEGFARPNNLGFARLGIVIGRKGLSRAVDRNQCKRWAREAFRVAQSELVGWDVVVRFRPPAAGRGSAGTRSEVIDVLSQIVRCRAS